MAEQFGSVIEDLVDTFGEVTGTLTRDGVDVAFTRGVITRETRDARAGRTDARRRTVLIEAAGLSSEPRAKSHVVFAGDPATWAVLESEPVAPGGTVIAWRLSLVDLVNR